MRKVLGVNIDNADRGTEGRNSTRNDNRTGRMKDKDKKDKEKETQNWRTGHIPVGFQHGHTFLVRDLNLHYQTTTL